MALEGYQYTFYFIQDKKQIGTQSEHPPPSPSLRYNSSICRSGRPSRAALACAGPNVTAVQPRAAGLARLPRRGPLGVRKRTSRAVDAVGCVVVAHRVQELTHGTCVAHALRPGTCCIPVRSLAARHARCIGHGTHSCGVGS